MFSREDTIFIVEKWYETRSLAFIILYDEPSNSEMHVIMVKTYHPGH